MITHAGAILLDGDIRDRVLLKDQRSSTRIQGFDVFLEGFSRALITRSEHGPVLLPQEALASFLAQPPEWFEHAQNRIEPVPALHPRALVDRERLLLLSVGPEMLQYAWMRADAGRPDWPITAILHSPQPIPRIRYLFTNHLMGTLGPHDALVCPTEAAREAVKATYAAVPASLRSTADIPMQLPVIPMGVDVADWSRQSREASRQALGLPSDPPILLWFGRLAPGDRGEMLPFLRTLAPCVERHGAHLVIAGDDTSHRIAGTLRELAAELGYGERLTVLPDVSQAAKHLLFAAADIFLALSDSMHEGFPLTIAEAMASGLPVIATDWAGHREWVKDGITGRLVPTYLPTDPSFGLITLYSGTAQENRWELSTATDLPAFIAATNDLLGSPEAAKRMGEQARRFAGMTFDWGVVIAQYDALWNEQLARSAAMPRQSTVFPQASFSKVFSSYPTRFLQGSDLLVVPQDAPTEELLPALGHHQHFRRDLLAEVVKVCRESPHGSTLSEIVAGISAAGARTADVERHVGRLLKHGFLQLKCSTAPSLTDAIFATSP
jgi:glycosyltransferase involved in cell wall biosynthesis